MGAARGRSRARQTTLAGGNFPHSYDTLVCRNPRSAKTVYMWESSKTESTKVDAFASAGLFPGYAGRPVRPVEDKHLRTAHLEPRNLAATNTSAMCRFTVLVAHVNHSGVDHMACSAWRA
eukprot:9413836-Pyramimonas_sp.AAC.1